MPHDTIDISIPLRNAANPGQGRGDVVRFPTKYI